MRSSSNVGINTTDWLSYQALYGLPTTATFLQYRSKIMDIDASDYNGSHQKHIAHLFYVRGIGTDSLSVYITGPGELQWKFQGTWTANPSGGPSSYTYEWRYRDYPSGTWSTVVSTAQQYTRQMPNNAIELQVKVTSANEFSYGTFVVLLGDGTRPMFSSQGIADKQVLPEQFQIYQNYPNPFNPETQISYQLPEPSQVTITISDLLGREVTRLVNRKQSAGYQSVNWTGVDAAGNKVGSGIYLYRITALGESGKQFTKVMKMLLSK